MQPGSLVKMFEPMSGDMLYGKMHTPGEALPFVKFEDMGDHTWQRNEHLLPWNGLPEATTASLQDNPMWGAF